MRVDLGSGGGRYGPMGPRAGDFRLGSRLSHDRTHHTFYFLLVQLQTRTLALSTAPTTKCIISYLPNVA